VPIYQFKLDDSVEPSKRKFDHDLENEMRVGEELYYHSTYNPRYIQELNAALVKTGIIPDNTIKKNLIIKDNFKNTKFYKFGLLFLNEREKYSRKDIFELPSSLRNTVYKISLRTGFHLAGDLFKEPIKKGIERKEKDFCLENFKINVIKKAIYKLDFYSFSNLKKYFPNLKTLNEFITKKEYLGDIKITISGLGSHLSSKNSEWRGSKKFQPHLIKDKINDKTLNFAANESNDKEFEKHFVKYLAKLYAKLKEKYEEVYLIRNERFFKLYEFADGKPLEPDYVLFLQQKEVPKILYYQVFIEPKGSYLKEKDA
ncbi:17911_t:CDS:2, partial [Funneliformis geosporum]